MPVNSISSSQAAQQQQAINNSAVTASRKQSDIQDTSKLKERNQAAEQQARVHQALQQKAQEPVKPVVNTNGQKIGTLINTAA